MLKHVFLWPLACLLVLNPCLGQTEQKRDDKRPALELLQLVGADAGLCVEVSDLNRRIPQFKNSALFDRLEQLPVYVAWKQSQEFHKLDKIRGVIENQTGQPLGQFVMNLFGESVVLAVYPRESGKPAGVLLLRAANGDALQNALSAWNREERIKLETIAFSKSQYQKRIEFKRDNAPADRPQFYFVRGEIFALSDNEAIIQGVVNRSLGQADQPALRESENYRAAKNSLPNDCWATLYFDPRAWKTGWESDEGKSKFEKVVASLWKRCHAVAAGLRADHGLSVDVALHYDSTNLPDRWRQLVERTHGFPQFLNQVPARAFWVFAGKQDLSGIDQIIAAEANEQTRQQWQNARQIGRGLLLGLDLFEDVLPKFRPNWGVYVVPRDPLDKAAVPVEGLLAIQLPPVPKEKNPITVRKALDNALSTGFNFLAAMQNSKAPTEPALVKSKELASGQMNWVESLGPYRPAYCVSDEYLIFASAPAVIEEFLSPTGPKLTTQGVFRLWSKRQNPPEGQLLFVSWQAIREFLTKHHDFLLDQAVNSHGLPREETEQRLKRFADVLELLDAVYLGIQIQEDQIRLTTGGLTAD